MPGDDPLVPRRPWRGRRVVLGVTGGVAAYKSVQLARDLTLLGCRVDAVLTPSAERFVGPLSFEAVTGRSVSGELLRVESSARHIHLAREADLVLVAPATADFIARAAQGRADDLLAAVVLATSAPVLLAPAMNDGMWSHPQTRRNVDHVREVLGYHTAGPEEGRLAHGEGLGAGRMLEPEALLEYAGRALEPEPILRGRRVLVTAGGTREPVDPVRFVGNRSSGRMGYALARAAWRRGGSVVLVSGPTELPDPPGVEVIRVETGVEMRDAVAELRPWSDLSVFSAAVADYRPRAARTEKVKRAAQGPAWSLELETNVHVARETRDGAPDGQVTVGFALETEELVEGATRKLESGDFDMVVANPAGDPDAGFEVPTNRATVLRHGREPERLPLLSKDDLAEAVLERAPGLKGADRARSREEGATAANETSEEPSEDRRAEMGG